MNDHLWKSSIHTLLKYAPQFGVDFEASGSTLHNDGTAYEIAFAATPESQHARVVLDPYPHQNAIEQRRLVKKNLEKLGRTFTDEFIELTDTLGSTDHYENRFWVGLGVDNNDVELYTSFGGTASNRLTELNATLSYLGYENTLNTSGFNCGPVSIASRSNVLTVYLRPTTIDALSDHMNPLFVDFLGEFIGTTVESRGILVSYKIGKSGITGAKLDLCSHCVSPTIYDETAVAAALGRKYLGAPILLPAHSRVSFWGISIGANASQSPRLHVYLRPPIDCLKELQTSRYAEAGVNV